MGYGYVLALICAVISFLLLHWPVGLDEDFMRISRQLNAIVLAVLVLFFCSFSYGQVQLVKDGKSIYNIVLSPGASPSEKHAADELQSHFKACTGIELPILEKVPEDGSPVIVLGCGAVAEKFGVKPSQKELGEQGFMFKTVGPDIVIAGSREAGTLYGVHRFLEEYLGVRWYAPGETKTPKVKNLTIANADRLVRPAFLFRYTTYTWPGADADFISRMAQNRGSGGVDNPHGVQYSFNGICHTYFSFIHPNEYFDAHPEYFSEIGGERRREETQLCLTNPDVLDIVTRKMLERMKNSPNTRQFNFSQMDYYNFCECPKCQAMNKKYGTPGGTQFWFVNELAKRTSKVYPDKFIGTLAYTFTENPPKGMEMHPNAAVWLCHMFPCCDSHPIATCPRNADYKRRAMAWSKICSHLYIWHYIVDFAHYYNPFPNFRAIAADLKFYRDIGVEGMFLQGMGQGPGGEFSRLRPYYAMKLAWDPDQDPDAIMVDFLKGYYGPAWKPIFEYITMLQDKVEKDNIHMHLYTNPAQGYLTDDIIARAKKMFDRAEALVAKNPKLLKRVQIARMPITYARIFPRNGYEFQNGRLIFTGDLASPIEAIGFIGQMQANGFATIREQGGDPKGLMGMSAIFFAKPPVVSLSNDYLSVDIVPLLAGRVLRIIDRKSGKCITAYNKKRVLFFPFCGGLESRVGESFMSYGWIEPASVISSTPTSITIALKTMNGFNLERTVTLEPDSPIIKVKSVLTNPSDKPKQARLRSHCELDLGDLKSTRVSFTDLSGKKVDQDMTKVIDGLRSGEYFRAEKAPRNQWMLTGSKGLAVTQRFNNETIDFTQLYAYPADIGELELELWSKTRTLQAGESMTLEQEIEIRNVPPAEAASKTITGRASLASFRPIKPSKDKSISKFLKAYEIEPEEFTWQMKLDKSLPGYDIFQVTFPSPYKNSAPQNKTVFGEYYKARKSGPRPAVIILHGVFDNRMVTTRPFANYLASGGTDALIITLPFHGDRRDKNAGGADWFLCDSKGLVSAWSQAVMDVRRARRFLSEQEDVDKTQINLMGVSIGAIIGALTIGVDGDFPKALFVLGGADLAGCISESPVCTPIMTAYRFKQNLNKQQFRAITKSIEPLTYAKRADNTEVLMINALHDEIVPPAASKKLAKALPHSEVVWVNGTHLKSPLKNLWPRARKFIGQ